MTPAEKLKALLEEIANTACVCEDFECRFCSEKQKAFPLLLSLARELLGAREALAVYADPENCTEDDGRCALKALSRIDAAIAEHLTPQA